MIAKARQLKSLSANADIERGGSIVLHDISWDLYEQLLLATEEQHVRMTYDRGDLELMSPQPQHEKGKC